MQTRQRKITGVIVKISEIVMRLDVARIIFQRLRKVIERADHVAAIQIDDSEVAISFRDVVAFRDGLLIEFCGVKVALLVKQQSLFERSEQPSDMATNRAKQAQLPLQLGFDLFYGQPLRPFLTYA